MKIAVAAARIYIRLRMKHRSNVEIMALMIENMKGSGAAQEVLGMPY
jgi:hypothetical protein